MFGSARPYSLHGLLHRRGGWLCGHQRGVPGLSWLVSMVTAPGHGVSTAAICRTMSGSASQMPPVLAASRCPVTSAGAAHRSWTWSACAAAARWAAEVNDTSAITGPGGPGSCAAMVDVSPRSAGQPLMTPSGTSMATFRHSPAPSAASTTWVMSL